MKTASMGLPYSVSGMASDMGGPESNAYIIPFPISVNKISPNVFRFLSIGLIKAGSMQHYKNKL